MHSSIRSCLIAVAASVVLGLSGATLASTSVFISVNTPPPALPVHEQPLCPGPGYVWRPGYWAWNGGDYYWVDGGWALAPVGMLWTPGYWGWNDSAYIWHAGYWGPRVGYYGGINYGHGYIGNGYHGGYWRGRTFFYNDTVNRVDVTRVHNVYHKTVINHVTVNRVSYNGGHGGTSARPSNRDRAYAQSRHPISRDERGRVPTHGAPHDGHRGPDHGAGQVGEPRNHAPTDRHAIPAHAARPRSNRHDQVQKRATGHQPNPTSPQAHQHPAPQGQRRDKQPQH